MAGGAQETTSRSGDKRNGKSVVGDNGHKFRRSIQRSPMPPNKARVGMGLEPRGVTQLQPDH